MKPEDQLDKLINTTKQIPLAMDIARIDALVATFPTQGPPPARGYRAPQLLTLALVIAGAVALLLYLNRGGGEPPQLAGVFPVVETQAEAPLTEAPAEDLVEQLEEKTIIPVALRAEPVVKDEVIVPALPTNPAPAATPPVLPEVLPAPVAKPTANRKGAPRKALPPVTAPRSPLDYGPATITGTWTSKTHDDNRSSSSLTLRMEERVGGRSFTWMLPVLLDRKEAETLRNASANGEFLEREAGRIFIEEEGSNKGRFSFQPHLPTRSRYEKEGWGTSNVVAKDILFFGTVRGVSLRPQQVTKKPVETTWLRYFTNNVNDSYLATLAEIGVSQEAVTELWRLPNTNVTNAELSKLRTMLDSLMANDAAPLEMPALVWAADNDKVLRSMLKQGYTDVSAAGLTALADAGVSDYYMTKVNLHRTQNFTPEDVAALFDTDMMVYDVYSFQQYLSPDLTVRDYQALQAAKIESYTARAFRGRGITELTVSDLLLAHREKISPTDIGRLNDRGIYHDNLRDYLTAKDAPSATDGGLGRIIDRNFGRRKKEYRASIVNLEAFTSLRVEDEIRVVVVQGDEYKAEVLTAGFGGKGLRIDLDVNRKGELTIRKKVKQGWRIEGMILSEIRLTVPSLEKLSVKSPARVYLTEEIGMLPGAFRAIVVE